MRRRCESGAHRSRSRAAQHEGSISQCGIICDLRLRYPLQPVMNQWVSAFRDVGAGRWPVLTRAAHLLSICCASVAQDRRSAQAATLVPALGRARLLVRPGAMQRLLRALPLATAYLLSRVGVWGLPHAEQKLAESMLGWLSAYALLTDDSMGRDDSTEKAVLLALRGSTFRAARFYDPPPFRSR